MTRRKTRPTPAGVPRSRSRWTRRERRSHVAIFRLIATTYPRNHVVYWWDSDGVVRGPLGVFIDEQSDITEADFERLVARCTAKQPEPTQ